MVKYLCKDQERENPNNLLSAFLLPSLVVLVLTELNYIPLIKKGKISLSMVFNVSGNILFKNAMGGEKLEQKHRGKGWRSA